MNATSFQFSSTSPAHVGMPLKRIPSNRSGAAGLATATLRQLLEDWRSVWSEREGIYREEG
jgi:hypothetical protein